MPALIGEPLGGKIVLIEVQMVHRIAGTVQQHGKAGHLAAIWQFWALIDQLYRIVSIGREIGEIGELRIG